MTKPSLFKKTSAPKVDANAIALGFSASRPHRTTGQAAMAFMAVSCACVVGVLGLHHWRQSMEESAQASAAQTSSLKWARAAVDTYAAWTGQLPCPSDVVAGEERRASNGQCILASGKGWLPVATLSRVLPVDRCEHGPSGATAPVGQGECKPAANLAIRYVSYRNPGQGGRDLTLASKRLNIDVVLGGTADVLDLCSKLADSKNAVTWNVTAGAQGADAQFAHTWDKDGRLYNVAYGLAVSANGATFSERNLSDRPEVESPSRKRDAGYTDLTEVVPFVQLFGNLACGQGLSAMYSINHTAEQYHQIAEIAKFKEAKDYLLQRAEFAAAGLGYAGLGAVEVAGDMTNEMTLILKSAVILSAVDHGACPEVWATLFGEMAALTGSTTAAAAALADAAAQAGHGAAQTAATIATQGTPIWELRHRQTMPEVSARLGMI